MNRLQVGCLLMLGLLLPSHIPAQQPPPQQQHSRFHPQLIGITPEQQKELEAFFTSVGQQRREVGSRLKALYRQLEALYDSYELDLQRALDIRKQIVKQQERLLALHGDNEIKLRRILNAEQFARLRVQMKSWREKAPHHNHGSGPEHGGDGPGHDDHVRDSKG
jgi:Heavy-metal resistance